MRVTDLVQYDDPLNPARDHILNLRRGQGLKLRRKTLMDGITRQQSINRARLDDLRPAGFRHQSVEAIFGPDQTDEFALWIGQSRGHSMHTP
ncbi:MAG: hypothetical protein Hens2KO_30990 [Henriciella sp.]